MRGAGKGTAHGVGFRGHGARRLRHAQRDDAEKMVVVEAVLARLNAAAASVDV